MIHYTRNLKSITSETLKSFFAGWPNRPSPETHLKLLLQSDEIMLAIDDNTGRAIIRHDILPPRYAVKALNKIMTLGEGLIEIVYEINFAGDTFSGLFRGRGLAVLATTPKNSLG